MPSPVALREQRLRKTKAQLIDEIDTLEQRAAALEAANKSSAPKRDLAEKEAQLRVALDNMRGGMKLVDRDLNYVLFNARYSKPLGGIVRAVDCPVDSRRRRRPAGNYAGSRCRGLVAPGVLTS